MKRYLLFVIAFVCVSIGAWAVLPPIDGDGYKLDEGPAGIGKWYINEQADVIAPEKVIIVEVTATDGVAGALQELTDILGGSTAKGAYNDFRNKLNESITASTSQGQGHNMTFDNFIANNKLILKVVYKKKGDAPETLTLSNADIAALNAINIPTIDLEDLKPADVFTLDNDNVKNLILPDGWTKAQVVAAASACGSLNAAMSIGSTTVSITQNNNTSQVDAATIMAYVKEPGTLFDSVFRLGYDGFTNTKVGLNGGGVSPSHTSLAGVKIVELAGHVSARDYAGGSKKINFAANGHLVFDKEADENSPTWMAAVGGGTRSLVGTPQYGALFGASLVELDLGDAIIYEADNEDLTFPVVGSVVDITTKVVLPTYSGLKTIPADCLNTGTQVRDICIPGNFENIKTRAFANRSADGMMTYIWTTGPDENVKYDNGAVFTDGGDFICHDEEGYVRNGCLYGTFTLPPNLKLIERFAFRSSDNVHDVYVLNEVAPECHVDAFSTIMYLANDAYDQESIKDGIITRDAYINNKSKYTFMTMLHYPRETATPNTQRYTDPSREYSVATGERDGNGNMIYFPNQTEYIFAHLQGSYGYTWKAWDDRRNWYDNEIKLDIHSLYRSEEATHQPTRPDLQTRANELWEDNPSTMLDNGHLEKYNRTFYDLTMGGNNEFGEVSGPKGDIIPYYQVERRPGVYLYPQAVTEGVTDENGDPVMVERQAVDENGKPKFKIDNNTPGLYVRDESQEYVIASNGGHYVKDHAYIEQSQMPNYNEYVATGKAYRLYNGEYININNSNFWNASGWYLYEEVYRAVDLVNHPEDADATQYNLETVYSFRLANEGEGGDRWTPEMETVQKTQTIKYNDYRGWHQFVLTAVAHNSTKDFEPLRSFITDNDWWTLCAPFDMRYNDLKKFFGTDSKGSGQNIPYLSKLMYVIRDVEHQTITLMFSKNLMEYKEQFRADDTNEGGSLAERVHGYIEDSEEGKYTPDEIAANPVILHAGVPYMIRPNLSVDENGDINATRQFDIYKNVNRDLYDRMKAAQELGGTYQKNLIYKGMYTVPAYVVGTSTTVTEGTTNKKEITMKDGTKFTYTSEGKTIKYHGKDVSYSISTDFTYTFVGTFYKSVMPQYCYFLGWDSEKNRAAFWYSRVQDTSGWNWNNETGVICPNFNTNLEISKATGLDNPARWILAGKNTVNDQTNIKCDDFKVGTAASNAKQYTMDYGATMNLASVDEEPLAEDFGNQEVLSIDEIQSLDVKGEWYNVNGQKLNGRPTQSGVYIMGHKKYVVK